MKNQNTLIELNNRFAGIVGTRYVNLLKAKPHMVRIQEVIALSAKKALKGVQGTAQVLDLGCGTGMTTLALCEVISIAEVTGIDNEPTMLNQYSMAMKKQREILDDRCILVRFVEQDILKYLQECEPQSFDVVVSGFTIHNIPRVTRPLVMKEIARVLRPGGAFVNGDKIVQDDLQLHEQTLMGQLAAYVDCYGATDPAFGLEWIRHYVRDDQDDLKQTESEVRNLLAEVGFKEINIFKRHRLDTVVTAVKRE